MKITADKAEYIYNPEHDMHLDGDYHKTEKGWSKKQKKKRPVNRQKMFIERNNERIIQSLFTKEEQNMSESTNEQFKDNYWEKANESQQLMINTLDNGREKEWLGSNANTCNFQESEIRKPGPKLLIAPIKKKSRAEEKIKLYGGDIGKLRDAVRCSIAVDKTSDLSKVLDGLKKQGVKIVCPPKNRFQKRLKSGYGDILLNVDFGNGFIGELQLHMKNMLCAKQFHGGHTLYEQERQIYNHYPQGAEPEDMNEEHRTKLEKLLKQQRKLYDRAYQGDIRMANEAEILNSKDVEYYLYGDDEFLSFKFKNKFPMFFANHQWRKVRSYLEFADNAREISKKEFVLRAKRLGIKF